MYLLDTNVVSELRRPKPHRGVLAWLDNVLEADLYISAVTVGEIQYGAEATRGRDPAKALEIEHWLERIIATFDIIPMDTRAFRHWAHLMQGQSRNLSEDAMIAATAHVHRLVVITRNTKDFESLGSPTLNPFEQ